MRTERPTHQKTMKVRKILCQDPVEDQEEEASAAVHAEADLAEATEVASVEAHAAASAALIITIITDPIMAVGDGDGGPDATITEAAVALADFSESFWLPLSL